MDEFNNELNGLIHYSSEGPSENRCVISQLRLCIMAVQRSKRRVSTEIKTEGELIDELRLRRAGQGANGEMGSVRAGEVQVNSDTQTAGFKSLRVHHWSLLSHLEKQVQGLDLVMEYKAMFSPQTWHPPSAHQMSPHLIFPFPSADWFSILDHPCFPTR
ncbi:unnamed protein product [Pleuronectes platessa]|uniref:Uncharacterized protein n=1 Tax=Pleuronectes platessa TaxID=8262 RepID=A0A9N7TQL9_PLEPL|nr:unnamed protein product [Pleuronectes platessa]